MAACPTLRLLGPVEIALDGAPIETDRRKAVALLAYLAVARQAHSRESLPALFWPEHEPAKAHAYLRRALWEINQALGEGWLEGDRETIGLRPDAGLWVDVVQFQALMEQRAEGGYEESVSLWRELGDPRQAGYLHALRLLGEVTYRTGDKARGRALIEESLALAQAAGDTIETAWSLLNRGMAAEEDRLANALNSLGSVEWLRGLAG